MKLLIACLLWLSLATCCHAQVDVINRKAGLNQLISVPAARPALWEVRKPDVVWPMGVSYTKEGEQVLWIYTGRTEQVIEVHAVWNNPDGEFPGKSVYRILVQKPGDAVVPDVDPQPGPDVDIETEFDLGENIQRIANTLQAGERAKMKKVFVEVSEGCYAGRYPSVVEAASALCSSLDKAKFHPTVVSKVKLAIRSAAKNGKLVSMRDIGGGLKEAARFIN